MLGQNLDNFDGAIRTDTRIDENTYGAGFGATSINIDEYLEYFQRKKDNYKNYKFIGSEPSCFLLEHLKNYAMPFLGNIEVWERLTGLLTRR